MPTPLDRLPTGHAKPMRFAAGLVLAVVASTAIVLQVGAQDDADEDSTETRATSGPGLCLEVQSSTLEAGAWSEILGAIYEATADNTNFFPAPVVASIPDLAAPWDPGSFPTVKIGVWASSERAPESTDQRRERLAGTECLRDGSEWTATISHDLVLSAAELILADARLPQDGADPLISADVKAAIDVEFRPSEASVRTALDWSKRVLFVDVGGLCWIDDSLSVDDGLVRVDSQADMDVSFGGEAGCALFQEFLDGRGAGERAIDLLPSEIPLADGTVARFVAETVEVNDSAIVVAGSAGHS